MAARAAAQPSRRPGPRPADALRACIVALVAAQLSAGCVWRWWGDDEEQAAAPIAEVEGPLRDPRLLCERVAIESGLRPLRPWDSRLPGSYDCSATSAAFGVAPGPMRSYIALHVYGRAAASALEVALQANVLDPNDEQAAFDALGRLVDRTFDYLGEPLPAELRDAIARHNPGVFALSALSARWVATPLGGSAVSWTLQLQGPQSP